MEAYERLREILDLHPSGAPASKVFDEILRVLFAPEEAALLTHMSFSPKPVEAIASAAGMQVKKAEEMLSSLSARVLVISRKKDGKNLYGLLPTIPGLFEFPFMQGVKTPELKKLAKLWEDYHRDGLAGAFAGRPTPVARVIPVEKSIDSKLRVHPYEEVRNLINNVGYIGLGECACRLTLRRCDKPTDTCLFFDGPARFLVEKKYAKEISREQAMDVLDRAEQAGLVHTSTNTADKATFICNCCKCCCLILRSLTEHEIGTAFAPSAYVASVSETDCPGCGGCLDDRCPMNAIRLVEDRPVVDAEKCIGCGLCVSACPTGTLVLAPRPGAPEVPKTAFDMLGKVLTEKGKLEGFMKLMKP